MRNRKSSVPEREIHVRLWEIFKNVILKEKFEFEDTQFVDIRVEPTINGRPDLVIEAVEKTKARKLPLLVIETKRKVPYKDPRFDPYSIDVIKQAVGYANQMGAPYFATCNGDIMVVFETFTPGVPLVQRRLKQYKVFWKEEFARIVLKELVRFKLGVGKWLPLDDVFVERLRSFHRFITPFMYEELNKKLKKEEMFRNEYVRWLKSQTYEYTDKVNETIADQIAYVLMNKIAFYKTLESQIADVDIDKLEKIEADSGKEFSERLQDKFKQLIKKADYEGIFQPTILDSVPVPDKLVYHMNEFIGELDAYNLGRIKADVIGRVYEDLISPDERHRLGQYYTPPPIVDLIIELCIKSPDDKVLDPGCGSGSFLVKAYHKLRDLKKKENPFRKDEDLHQELLEQVYGIDINPFPAQLSSMNLAVRNLRVRSKHINLFPMDFFRVKPGMALLPKEFDAVTTNPPYTRQEEMEYKDRIREIALTYSDGSKIELGARAGIYAYFFTHSAKFLRDKGRMGYITANTWLDVGFGKGLKKFFLDYFKILVVLEFDAAVFGRALVNTCVVILEKEKVESERKKNLVRFARLKKKKDITKVVAALLNVKRSYEDDGIKISIQKQSELESKERWGKFIRAPSVYFNILKNPKIAQLGKIAKIKRGMVTGYNDFFILDKGKLKVWGIEENYLQPMVTSIRELTNVELLPNDISHQVLMVHDAKEELIGKKVLHYIQHGEEIEVTTKRGTRIATAAVKGLNNLKTCSQREIWYDLGKHEPPPIISPYLMWDRVVFAHNKAKALAPNTLHYVYPKHSKDVQFLLGVLNSTLVALLLELTGRSYGGGVLKIEAYELKMLPVINPGKVSAAEKNKVENTLSKIISSQSSGDKKRENSARNELDKVVFDILGLSKKERKQVLEGLSSLREMRLRRKEVKALVETAEKWKPREKPKKVKRIVEDVHSKRLDAWMKD